MKVVHLAVVFILVLAFGACTRQEEIKGKSMSLVLADNVKSLDPAVAYDAISLEVMALSLESLFQYKYTKVPLELEPLLAESMPTISKDKKNYTIKIKKGVMWQDDAAFPNGKGRELKAGDFIYAWKRMLLPEIQSPGTWIFDGKVVGWEAYKKKLIENRAKAEEILQESVDGLKATDDYTIEIKLLQPYPQLLNVLAMGFGSPMAKEVTAKYGQQGLNEKMVGTGPFRLKDFRKDSRIIVEKSPAFRGETFPSDGDEDAKKTGLLAAAGKPLPFVDEIVFSIIKESQPRWLQFMKGNLDAAGIPKDSFDAAVANGELKADLKEKGLQLNKGEEAIIWYLNFNMKDKVVGGKNADLRRAIVMAVDREELIRKFLNGRGVKATSIVPRVIAGNSGRPDLVGDYNVEKAKEYLAKAGYPGGKGLPTLKFDLRGSSTDAKQQAEFIKKSLAAIGVNMDIVVNTFPAYLEKEKNGNLQFFTGGWVADYPDAENFLFLLYSKNVSPGPNASNYVNPDFDKVYEKLAAMSPSSERTALIKKAEDIAFQDSVWSMLFYPIAYDIFHGWTKNFRPNSLILNQDKYWDVEPEKRREMRRKL
ncbi:MAG TPA: ABC transporter substrate-binding protein [Bdellovibrionota bacterium]|jgi:ABC-type transport system substrate-binding protein